MNLLDKDIICDKNQKYSCSNCGSICCKSFSVIIDNETRTNLTKLDIVKNKIIETKINFELTKDNKFYMPIIKKNSQYQCLFFDEEKQCLIHNENGYESKPVSCQVFPFSTYLDKNENIHIELSFKCKSIRENYGDSLEDIKRVIAARCINLEHYPESFLLYNKRIEQNEMFKITDKLKEILDDTTLNLDDTMFKYYSFINALRLKVKRKPDIDIKTLISEEDITFDTPKPGLKKLSRLLLTVFISNICLYSTYSRKNPLFKSAIKLLRRYNKLFLSIYNLNEKTELPIFKDNINLKLLNSFKFKADSRSDELIRRYIKSNLTRYKHLSNNNKDLQFLNKTIIYYSLIKTLSTIHALSENSKEITFNNVSESINKIDQVFYHTNNTLTPINFIEKTLKLFINKLLENDAVVSYLITKGLST